MIGETVTVTRVGAIDGEDEQGAPTFGADTTFDIENVAVAPRGSEENADSSGVAVLTGYDLYCPFDTPALEPSDRFTIRDTPGWQMTGDSTGAGWVSPFTGVGKGVVVSVVRAT